MHKRKHGLHNRLKGFTVVEIMTTIGVLAVVSTLTAFVLNPFELMRESRDAQRLNDIAQISKAIQLANLAHLDLGLQNTVYVSLPADGSGNCPVITPELQGGYAYECVPEAVYQKADGTGWIPVNFQQIMSAINSDPEFLAVPAAQRSASITTILPADPVNSVDSGFYYSYIIEGRKYELLARLESIKYREKAQNDGGVDALTYELGDTFLPWAIATGGAFTPTSCTPRELSSGLLAYWQFDEGLGSTPADSSGGCSAGTLAGSTSWQDGKQGSAVYFDGSAGGKMTVPAFDASTVKAISAWVKPTTNRGSIVGQLFNGSCFQVQLTPESSFNPEGAVKNTVSPQVNPTNKFLHSIIPVNPASKKIQIGQWNHIVVNNIDTASAGPSYFNGDVTLTPQQSSYGTYSGILENFTVAGSINCGPGSTFVGSIDNLRIYNRVLSAEEVQVLYQSGL